MILSAIVMFSWVRINIDRLIEIISINFYFILTLNREFKIFITHTNHRNVEKVLLSMKNVQQTIHFVLNESFEKLNLKLITNLRALYEKCSTVFRSILLRSDQIFMIEKSNIFILKDSRHLKSAALQCISWNYVRDELSLLIRLHHLFNHDSFLMFLRDAYSIDYDMHHVVASEIISLQ